MKGVSVLRASNRRVQAWKNGGGTTTEIAMRPPGAGLDEFDWRISVASVSVPGRFSHFGDVDRVLAVIEGQLELTFDGGDVVRLDATTSSVGFNGEAGVVGSPLGGVVTDLNLMIRRGHYTGSIRTIASPSAQLEEVETPFLIVLFTGEGSVGLHDGAMSMGPLDAVQIEERQGEQIGISSAGNVYLLSIA